VAKIMAAVPTKARVPLDCFVTDYLDSYVNNFKDIFKHGDRRAREMYAKFIYKNIWHVKSCSHDTRSIGMPGNE
jgi:hypothetical protein